MIAPAVCARGRLGLLFTAHSFFLIISFSVILQGIFAAAASPNPTTQQTRRYEMRYLVSDELLQELDRSIFHERLCQALPASVNGSQDAPITIKRPLRPHELLNIDDDDDQRRAHYRPRSSSSAQSTLAAYIPLSRAHSA